MSDNRKKATLEFSTTDLPVIAHAFMIARTTALMTGNPIAQKRLGGLVAMVEQLIPDGAREFEGEDWCEIGICLETAKRYGIAFENWGWRANGQTGRIVVDIDGRCWSGRNTDVPKNDDRIAAVAALLKDLAPLTAEWADLPDIESRKRFAAAKPEVAPEPEPLSGEFNP